MVTWIEYPDGSYRVGDDIYHSYDDAKERYDFLTQKANRPIVRVTIAINVENARKVLVNSSGSVKEAEIIEAMTSDEIKDEVLKHCKCWAITEVKGDNANENNTN